MNQTPYLRPTALQHMRGFLAEFGTGLPPWSTSDEVMDELVGLLHAHRGDGDFFEKLEPFIEELRGHAQRGEAGLTARDAEVLSRATVQSIVEELQTKLRAASRSASSSIVSAVVGDRAARLLCLGLLSSGLVACTDAAAKSAPPSEPGVPSPSAPSAQPAANPTPPATGSTDELVELFKNKSPQQVAAELEKTFDAGAPTPNTKPRPNPNANKPRYKGVEL